MLVLMQNRKNMLWKSFMGKTCTCIIHVIMLVVTRCSYGGMIRDGHSRVSFIRSSELCQHLSVPSHQTTCHQVLINPSSEWGT